MISQWLEAQNLYSCLASILQILSIRVSKAFALISPKLLGVEHETGARLKTTIG